MIPLHILWPSTESREQTLGIQAGWSIPLSQAVGPEEMAKLDRLLRDAVSQASTNATEHVLGEADAMTWRVTIEQIGSEAEPVHHAIAIIESVPREIVASLVALGTERVVSGIVSLVRQALGEVRETAGNDEAHLELRYHPDLLMQMCREEVIQRYGLRSIERCEWQQAGELERPPDEHGPIRPLFLITVQGDGKHVEYSVDDGGTVREHRAAGITVDSPNLFPENVPDYESLKYLVQENSGTRWPSQDGTDRSEEIAIFAILDFERIEPLGGDQDMALIDRVTALSPEVGNQIDLASKDAVRRFIPDLDSDDSEAAPYRVGPAADGLTELFVASLITVGYVVNSIQAAQYAISVTRWLKNWVRSKGDPHLDVRVFFPARVLVALCENHVRNQYHPRAQLKTDWFNLTDQFYGGYSSPAHPTGEVKYLVTVASRAKIYAYVLEGTGKVLRHSVREGEREVLLPPPDLFEAEDSNGRDHPQKIEPQ